jgi:hypothetical protein
MNGKELIKRLERILIFGFSCSSGTSVLLCRRLVQDLDLKVSSMTQFGLLLVAILSVILAFSTFTPNTVFLAFRFSLLWTALLTTIWLLVSVLFQIGTYSFSI